jgi:hypothetical protein
MSDTARVKRLCRNSIQRKRGPCAAAWLIIKIRNASECAVKIGGALVPKESGPRSHPSPLSPKVGAAIPAMNCDIHWARITAT